MERFTEYHENIPVLKDKKMFPEAVAKLAHYEDLEEQGLLVRLPYNLETCGVVYYVDTKDCEIYRLNADNITISKMMISRKVAYEIDSYEFFYEDFGRIVFTTKSEAEKALAEMGCE